MIDSYKLVKSFPISSFCDKPKSFFQRLVLIMPTLITPAMKEAEIQQNLLTEYKRALNSGLEANMAIVITWMAEFTVLYLSQCSLWGHKHTSSGNFLFIGGISLIAKLLKVMVHQQIETKNVRHPVKHGEVLYILKNSLDTNFECPSLPLKIRK